MIISPQNILSTKIAVTGTATSLFTLMDTAGSIGTSANYYIGQGANSITITAEDGNIRVGVAGLTPTAAAGELVTSGMKLTLTNLDLNTVKLIRTGGANVACSLLIETLPVDAQISGVSAASSSSGGTSSSFAAAFPSTGTAVGASDGANMAPLLVDGSGFLKVNVAAGGGAGGTSSTFGAAIPGTGTAAGMSDGTNMQLPRVFDADSGAGTQYVQGVSLRKTASGGSVEAGTSSDPLRVDPTGTTTQPVSLAANVSVVGEVANAAADSGNPVKIGGIGRTTNPVAVADADRVNAMFDKVGKQVVTLNSPRQLVGSQTTTISASTAETTTVTAVASTFLDLTSIAISNTSATATRVDIRDTTAGSVIFSIYIPAGDVRGIAFQTPLPQTTVNTNWTCQSSASVTDLRVFMQFIKNI
jgi:hypothetical protein